MKIKIIHTPDGVRDWLPEECFAKNKTIESIENIFTGYGYKKLESPIFEFAEVFAVTNMSQNKLYRFSDEKGDAIALRADMTPPIVRIACTAYKNEQSNQRFFYSGNVFTNKKNLQGKLKESTQAGVELIGINSAEADAEAIEITIKSLEAAGVKNFTINVGHVDFIKGILAECGIDNKTQILELIDNTDYVGIKSILENLPVQNELKQIIESIPLLIGKIDLVMQYKNKTTNKTSQAALDRMIAIYELLKDAELDEHIMFDLGMVSNLSYYTGVAFRAYAFGTGFAVASGGRYDNLAAKFGCDMPSVGVSLKINNIMDVVYSNGTEHICNKKTVLLCSKEQARKSAYSLANNLRMNGIIVENSLTDFKHAQDYSKQKNINTILYTENENDVRLLNVQNGTEQTYSSHEELINDITRGC